MNNKVALGLAIAGNCMVAGVTYAVRGWSASGAHAAARNTARFSALCFVVAFAGPGMVRFIRNLPANTSLVRSFVAAHLIHFTTVLALLIGFESGHLREHPGQGSAVISIGFTLIVLLGLTASDGASRLSTVVNRITLYAVSVIFFAAFIRHPMWPLRVISLAIAVALILRLTHGLDFSRSRMEEEKSRSAAQS